MFDKGIREAIEEHELAEIGRIKAGLRAEFYSGDRFLSATAPEFELDLLHG